MGSVLHTYDREYLIALRNLAQQALNDPEALDITQQEWESQDWYKWLSMLSQMCQDQIGQQERTIASEQTVE
ncbi:hypothetical protein KKF92_00400 [Patescibacteria group bacterium]|nr:hypothetical protein [Patescibacteria group bacterium]